MNTWKSICLCLCLILTAVSAQGCALLAAGAVGGAGYAVATGAAAKNYDQSLEYVYQAVHRALADMDAYISIDDFGALRTKVHAEDISGRNIRINIDAVTDNTSRVRVRVGNVGNKAASAQIFDAIDSQLYLK